jgi:hypothetical protein
VDRAAFLAAVGATDRWVRRAPAAFAPRGSSWTHWFATTRLFVTWLESGERDPAPYLSDPEHEVYRLLRALVLEVAREARNSGARFRLVVLPSLPDLEGARGPQGPYWRGLVADLEGRGLECIDVTPVLQAAGAAEDRSLWMPQQHYGPEANRLVADAVERALAP